MANEEQLKILKQGVEVWNKWRKEHPDEEIDLGEADLAGANLRGANLEGAYLEKADLEGAYLTQANLRRAYLVVAYLGRTHLEGANLTQANLVWADLGWADLRGATLQWTNLAGADLGWADLRGAILVWAHLGDANLEGADLEGANLTEANLVKTDLRKADITGAALYGTARDDWIIDGIECNYVFWEPYFEHYFKERETERKKQWELEHRTPKDRNFRPGEFEELYKQLPTFDYFFKHGFTALDAVIMSRVVQGINERHQEFELRLDSFHSRGQPHATFTVLHKEVVEEAKKQVTTDYEGKLTAIQDKQEEIMEILSRTVSNQYSITARGDVIITNIQKSDIKQLAVGKHIQQRSSEVSEGGEVTMGDTRIAGRDYIEKVSGHATVKTGDSYQGVKPDDIEQLKTREDLQQRYQALNKKVGDLRSTYIAEKNPTTRLKLKTQIEETENNFKQIEQQLEALDHQQDIIRSMIDLIQSLPNLHDSESQRAFLVSAGLDAEAYDQIPVGKPPVQFASLLVSTLAKYGTLANRRHALEAVVEAAKNYIGQKKRIQCDELIQNIQMYFTENA